MMRTIPLSDHPADRDSSTLLVGEYTRTGLPAGDIRRAAFSLWRWRAGFVVSAHGEGVGESIAIAGSFPSRAEAMDAACDAFGRVMQ